MRLYKNNSGQWFGTVRDAQRTKALTGLEWKEVNVPTSKADLLDFLNDNKVGLEEGQGSTGTCKPIVAPYDPDAPVNQTREEIIQKYYPQGRPHPWTTIRECAEQASLKDLSVALAVFLNRYEEELS